MFDHAETLLQKRRIAAAPAAEPEVIADMDLLRPQACQLVKEPRWRARRVYGVEPRDMHMIDAERMDGVEPRAEGEQRPRR
jgi:hypothetical protein